MRKIGLIAALLLLCGFGGAQTLNFTAGYSFTDIVNQSYNSFYGWHNIQMIGSSRAVYTGATSASCNIYNAVKFTIQTGDDPLSNGSNRDEFADMFGTTQQDESAASGTQYYAVSTCIPSPWIDPAGGSQWFIIDQLHANDSNTGHSAQAVFQFLLASSLNSANHYGMRTVGGPITGSGTVPSADDIFTDLGPHVYNTEVDWVFKTTWGSDVDGTGHVTVYKKIIGTDASFNQVVDYSAPNLYSVSGVNQPIFYWKRGIYRGDNGTQGTASYYAGPFVRASTMADAELGAFGHYP
jgi:hypothetical protein